MRLSFASLLAGMVVASGCFVAAPQSVAADSASGVSDLSSGKVAAKPLYRDPVHDGAADPTVIWSREEKKWFMFYTNRRAKLATKDPKDLHWFHGTPIGIAESSDGGATWKYRDTAKIAYGEKDYTFWAPEVIDDGGVYHMYVTVVPGIFTDWNHPRQIVHLTSSDLLNWKTESALKLSSDRVIDPCVVRLPDGTWRMWYNNERDRKSIYYADSKDLFDWQDHGKVAGVGDRAGEGPKVFHWKNAYWMLVDVWRGQGVYRSSDALHWDKQEKNLLGTPGTGPDDGEFGRHADVIVSGDRAFLFYFTHPAMNAPNKAELDPVERARSTIHVTELQEEKGELSCDRNAPTHILLKSGTAK